MITQKQSFTQRLAVVQKLITKFNAVQEEIE